MQYKCRPFFVFMGKTEEFCCPESILLVDTPAPAACFMAVERMLKAELLPVPGVLNAARELILQMKKDKADGRSSGAAIEKFLDEVKPIKN